MPSSTTLEVVNEGGDMDVFLSQVANMDEGDVRIDVFSYDHNLTAGSGELWWSGILLIDGIQQEDAPTPSIVSFTATDDLAHLKTQRWSFDDPDDYEETRHRVHHPPLPVECRNRHAFADNDVFSRVQDIICEGYDESYFQPRADQFTVALHHIGTSPNEINPVTEWLPAPMWDILQSIAITNLRIFRAWPLARLAVAFHYMQADVCHGPRLRLSEGRRPVRAQRWQRAIFSDLRPGFMSPASAQRGHLTPRTRECTSSAAASRRTALPSSSSRGSRTGGATSPSRRALSCTAAPASATS